MVGAFLEPAGILLHALEESIGQLRLTRRVFPFPIGEPGPYRGARNEPEATADEEAHEEPIESGARHREES
jgi:hypothetical protein